MKYTWLFFFVSFLNVGTSFSAENKDGLWCVLSKTSDAEDGSKTKVDVDIFENKKDGAVEVSGAAAKTAMHRELVAEVVRPDGNEKEDSGQMCKSSSADDLVILCVDIEEKARWLAGAAVKAFGAFWGNLQEKED